ncbi:MAG: hypothetical protein FWD46_04015 [Cystobacterineae bacterium]|nr:hypothetical protein [Cystobacterineae bacterium]
MLPDITTLSPIELSASFSVFITGFENNSDAANVELSLSSVLPAKVESSFAGNTKHFLVTVYYDEENIFSEGLANIRLSLSNLAEAQGGIQSIRIPIMDGLEKNRPIPITQSNMEAFNSYANTAEGLIRHYRLIENVVLPLLANNWTPIGTSTAPFEGSFDGNNNHMVGLRFFPVHPDSEDGRGLFGIISEGAVIENLGMLDVNIITASSPAAGSVVGRNNGGVVRNCHVTGRVEPFGAAGGGVVGLNDFGTVQNCSMEGYVGGISSSLSSVGGVVGINNGGTVSNCYATGSVATPARIVGGLVGANEGGLVENSYTTNNVNSLYSVGGLVGSNKGTIRNCYTTGHINDSGSAFLVGGVVGWNSGTVENCYATGRVSNGYGYIGGIVGDGSTERNCVALNSRISVTNNPTPIGRIAGRSSATSMNYARQNMALYRDNVLMDTTTLEFGLFSIHGQDIALSGNDSVSNLQWWLTSSNWSTDAGASAWDFENVWEWGSRNLPILRNVGGTQAPWVLSS